MTVNQYTIPIIVIIESDDADHLIREIGETIYDAVKECVSKPDFDDKVKYFDMQYSLHKRMSDEEVK